MSAPSTEATRIQNTTLSTKSNGWQYPRLLELRYPKKIGSTEDRMNWIASMMADARLGDRDKLILTRLAMHLNLKTQRCDPSLRLLAFEVSSFKGTEKSAVRSVRLSLESGERLGWIRRHFRFGGYVRRNQSNFYDLGVPTNPRDVGLEPAQAGDGWHARQMTDRVSVCGPFKTREGVQNWIEEHGPAPLDRTKTAPRPDKNRSSIGLHSPPNLEYSNLEYSKSSVSSIQHRSLSRSDAREVSNVGKQGVVEGVVTLLPRQTLYTPDDVETVRDMILDYGHDLNGYQAMSIAGIVECSRQLKQDLDGGVIRAMAADGHFRINGKDQVCVPDEPE